MGQWIWEARAYRIMGMYKSEDASEMLNTAESLLNSKRDVIAKGDMDEEVARIWRVRAERAAAAGDFSTAHKAVKKLEQMASAGGSISIDRTHHGAAGTVLVAQQKFADAVSHLEDDFANPLSLKVLLTAYEKSGATEKASALRKKLTAWRIPSVEEALVVPEMRSKEGAVVARK